MPASYPTSIKSFTGKTDLIDDVMAVDVNEIQDEVAAIETELGVLIKGSFATAKARVEDAEARILAAEGDITTITVHAIAQGRLTLESGVPISATDQTAKTTVYYTPYLGNRIGLYDGSSWAIHTFTERSLSLAGLTANKNHDIFIYDNAGTLTLEAVVWTNNTTRATALALQDGVYVKSGATTRRYLGTIRTTATTGQCEDTVLRRFVWNMYNRIRRTLFKSTGSGGTYDSATYRQWAADNTQIIQFVVGDVSLIEGGISISASSSALASASLRAILCIDDLAAANGATFRELGAAGWNQASLNLFASDNGQTIVAAGYHYLNPEQASNTTTPNAFAACYMRGVVEA